MHKHPVERAVSPRPLERAISPGRSSAPSPLVGRARHLPWHLRSPATLYEFLYLQPQPRAALPSTSQSGISDITPLFTLHEFTERGGRRLVGTVGTGRLSLLALRCVSAPHPSPPVVLAHDATLRRTCADTAASLSTDTPPPHSRRRSLRVAEACCRRSVFLRVLPKCSIGVRHTSPFL